MNSQVYLVVAGALLVRIGLAIHHTGAVRSKNAAGMMARSIASICGSILGLWLFGLAIALGSGHDYFAIDTSLLAGGLADRSVVPIVLATMVSALVAGGIVDGALAERCRFWPAILASSLASCLIVPLAMFWSGAFLGHYQFNDAAGACYIHWAAGVAAIVGAGMVGARSGKYNRDGSSNGIPGHSIPLIGAGTLLFFVGFTLWMVIVPSLTVERVVLVALIGAAGGGFAALLFGQFRYGKPDVHLISTGVIAGLISISGAADWLTPRWAMAAGAMGGMLASYLAIVADMRWRIDDPSGLAVAHATGGVVGTLSAALVAPGGWSNGIHQLIPQSIGLIAVGLLSAAVICAALIIPRLIGRLRSKEADEYDGLDLAEHDVGAYPDFQQTMIKSYHLREA